MNQKGFIALPLTTWALIGMGVVILGLGLALKFQTLRLESCKAEYQAFVSQTKALGEEAQRKKVAQEAKDKLNKEKADAERNKLLHDNSALVKRLRDNARSGFVPRASPDTSKPERACFDQSQVDRAIRDFAERVAELIGEGQSAVDDLNNAKTWAQDR